MSKLIVVLIAFLLFISFSSAVKISPTQQRIEMSAYETSCTNIWVLPEKDYSISSMWSIDGRGDLDKYTLTPEKIRMATNYTYLSDGKYEFCFNPNRGGNFSGIIYFYDEANMVEIGSWIDISVYGANIEERITLITGNVVAKNNEYRFDLMAVVALLIVLLVILLKKTLRSGRSISYS